MNKETHTNCRKISGDLAGLRAKILHGIRTHMIQVTVPNERVHRQAEAFTVATVQMAQLDDAP